MHLQQTKRGSLKSGGPQYYFHDLTPPVKMFLRKQGAVRVALVTPYGATKSDYFAVSKDHKLDSKQRAVSGKVGHDRIQQGHAGESIGESIRKWYNLASGDFERIDVEIDIPEDVLYVTPLKYKYANSSKAREISRIERPLTFTRDYASPFWRKQIDNVEAKKSDTAIWLAEICRIIKDHATGSKVAHVQEPDLLRASGPLKHFGVALGAYVGKGYDCVISEFSFLEYPTYRVPVEIKRHSKNFSYQQKKYGKDELSRQLCYVLFMISKTCLGILI